MRKILNKLPKVSLAMQCGLACFAIAFTACDSGSSSSGTGENEITAATFDDLEACTESLEGETAYVKDEKAMYTCEDGEWTVCTDCDTAGAPSKAGESSASKGKSSSSKRKSDYVCEIYSLSDAQKCECNEEREDSLAYNYDSSVELVCIFDVYLNKWGWVENKKEDSGDEGEDLSSESKGESSSSSVEKAKSSSSSVKPDGGDKNSSSGGKAESADSKSSSSSAKPDSSGDTPSSSSSSSSKKVQSSSSYDRTHAFSGKLWRSGEYKTFIDDRDGREYYYLTYVGKDTSGMYDTISVMVENLNVGEMVPGTGDQSDDTKIERYCYDNDTLKCMEYGGLYQWAEMMQLPSECNTKSCADQIKPNHQGICPSGWHLLTYNDFYIVVHSKDNNHGVEGVRAGPFGGYNNTGYSLVGAGYNWNYEFSHITKTTYWHYPQELEGYEDDSSLSGAQTNSSTGISSNRALKTHGLSVRCVMDK